jgi:hypothetical protein
MTKKMKQVMMAGVVSVLCATGTLIWTGCDTASADEELVISPSSVVLSAGQSQHFTVSGGYHYTWSLEGSGSGSGTTSSAQGSLSSLNGSEVNYTAPSGDSLSGSVKLNVKSTIPGSGESVSNSAAYEVTGYAQITFKSALSPMVISPSLVTVTVTVTTNFPLTVSGGTAPYSWKVSDEAKGKITGITGTTATYSSLTMGNNTITCDDANGRRASATVKW